MSATPRTHGDSLSTECPLLLSESLSYPPCGAFPVTLIASGALMLVTGCAATTSTITGHGARRRPPPTTITNNNKSTTTTTANNNNNPPLSHQLTSITTTATTDATTKLASSTATSSPATTTTTTNNTSNINNNNNIGMGFLRAPHQHLKAPSAPVHHHHHHHHNQQQQQESFTGRFTTMLDHCQKKIRLLQGPSSLFTTLVTKARRKERESPATEQEHKLYLEEAVLERKIPETDLRQLVELPPGLGYHEWLASHTIDFFQHINLVYGTIAEFCTMSGCSDMSGPATRPYLWFDEKGKKVRVAAPQYIDYVMTFTQKTINDETIFPTKFENDFPVSFESIVKKIHRLLFHVIAHLYHSHFRELVLLSLHAHLNCIFAHFTLFNERFRLIDEKETEILHDLVLALRLHPEDRDHREPPGDNGTGIDNPVRPSSADSSLAVAGTSSSGRASPAAGAIPTTEGAPVEPQSAQTRLEDSSVAGIHSTAVTPTHTTTPFITPDVADTRP